MNRRSTANDGGSLSANEECMGVPCIRATWLACKLRGSHAQYDDVDGDETDVPPSNIGESTDTEMSSSVTAENMVFSSPPSIGAASTSLKTRESVKVIHAIYANLMRCAHISSNWAPKI